VIIIGNRNERHLQPVVQNVNQIQSQRLVAGKTFCVESFIFSKIPKEFKSFSLGLRCPCRTGNRPIVSFYTPEWPTEARNSQKQVVFAIFGTFSGFSGTVESFSGAVE
jgi:hypothetical protein